MHLKAHNQKVLRKLAIDESALIRVHFEAPYNKRREYDVTEDFHLFLHYFSQPNVLRTLKLTGVKFSRNQFLLLAVGIHKSRTLEKLVFYKVSRSNGGFWYLANAIRYSVTLKELVFEKVEMSTCHYSMLTKVMLSNDRIKSLSLKSARKIHQLFPVLCEFLRNDSNLSALRLSKIKFTDAMLARLLESINHRSNLTRLEVDHNSISFSDAALCEMLKNNRCITYLNVSYNYINNYNNGIKPFTKALIDNQTIRRLNIIGTVQDATEFFLESLPLIKSLSHLNMIRGHREPRYFDVLGAALAQCTGLTRLSLKNYSYIEFTEILKFDQYLARLNISDNYFDDNALRTFLQSFANHQALRHLTMRRCQITSESMDFFSLFINNNHTLTYLDLGENYIGTIGAEKLAESLRVNRSLTQLKLASNYIGYKGACCLSHVLIYFNNTLTKLNIRDNAYGSDILTSLSTLMQKNPKLLISIFKMHLLGLEGAEKLKSYIESRPGVNHFKYICRKHRENVRSMDNKGSKALSEALANSQCITGLIIYHGGVSFHENMDLLLKSLDHIQYLYTIEFEFTWLDKADIIKLLRWLNYNKIIRKLNLSDNIYVSHCVQDVAGFLRSNQSLTELNLARCNFSSKALGPIFAVVSQNITLRKLNLSGLKFEDSYDFLGNCFTTNNTITHLNIRPARYMISIQNKRVLFNKASFNGSLVYCRYDVVREEPIPAIELNRNNKLLALMLLKEYALLNIIRASNHTLADVHSLFMLVKTVFFIIISRVYSGYTYNDCKSLFQSFEISIKSSREYREELGFFNKKPTIPPTWNNEELTPEFSITKYRRLT